MDASFARDAINATLSLFDKHGLAFEAGAEELRKLQSFELDQPKSMFGASWRLANSAKFLAGRVPEPLRTALVSTACAGYEHCAANNETFKKSLEDTRAALPSSGRLSESDILDIFATALSATAVEPADGTSDVSADIPEPTAQPQRQGTRRKYIFSPPTPMPFRDRFETMFEHFATIPLGANGEPQQVAHENFRQALADIMRVGDQGRTFTEFVPLDKDLQDLEPRLVRLAHSSTPRSLQENARASRRLAESLDFGQASPEDYRYGRSAWLASAYWNSQLAKYWPASRPHVVYDFLGYLTTIQAELRYSDADFLLLLRVSFSICRIASHDGLMPLQFMSTAAERLSEWLQHTAGTILASAGPGRVPPSRVPYDTRLAGCERWAFAEKLLKLWRASESDRAAASTILLEMGAWDPRRANRLLSQVLNPQEPEFEVWSEQIRTMAEHSKRVRVVRPNPWAADSGKPITVEHEAVAILAADVVDRHYQVLGGDISLRGHDFRERRVPTFVCSAEFGPLGLFKLDTAERVGREVKNFAKYAQRLHPRYRASRCDESKAVITEPDDAKQFVQGALTSYVFTEDETPRTLNNWFMSAPLDRTQGLCVELFERALRPWYGHATSATIDVFAEFPIFSHSELTRLVTECSQCHGFDLVKSSPQVRMRVAVDWISSMLDCIEGVGHTDGAVAQLTSELQVVRSYRSVCHGDLHLDNILVVGKPGAEYPCVIDFEATHEGYVLKDFGRFVAAAVCRTFVWSKDDLEALLSVLPALLLDWGLEMPPPAVPPSTSVQRVCGAITAAKQGIRLAWRAGSRPTHVELVATLVASFLPFARYPDTSAVGARLCLELCAQFVESLAVPA
ncbi:MAG: phosphotransferase [Vicinamibacterales bacterium]